MLHLLPLALHVATGKFDTTLLPYSSSAGDGRWLSIGVALSTSRAIWRRIEAQMSSKCVSRFVRVVL